MTSQSNIPPRLVGLAAYTIKEFRDGVLGSEQ